MARNSSRNRLITIYFLFCFIYVFFQISLFVIEWLYQQHWYLLILLFLFVFSIFDRNKKFLLRYIPCPANTIITILGLVLLINTTIQYDIRRSQLIGVDKNGSSTGPNSPSTSAKYSGEYKTFHPNGNLQSKGEYLEGQKIGIWHYYDLKGEIVKTTEIKEMRVGAICFDGWKSGATGRGACSHHGGVREWIEKEVEIEVER
jgi:energy-coupling factor transporter transmembrane protein EcfT